MKVLAGPHSPTPESLLPARRWESAATAVSTLYAEVSQARPRPNRRVPRTARRMQNETTVPPRLQKEIAAQASGLSQDSHLDPRTFSVHSSQLGRVSTLGEERWTEPSSCAPNVERSTRSGRTLYAAAASKSHGAEHHSLRKLRSGLFPNKRSLGWTVGHFRRPTTLVAAGTLRDWFG